MNNIKKYRLLHNMKQIELCRILGISQGALSGWETGKYEPDIKSLNSMAKRFNITVDELLGNGSQETVIDMPSNIFPITKKRFPLLGEIACGMPKFADENRESYIESGTDIQADFCLKAVGDSMIGARILDGDIVFIKEMPIVTNGDIAAVIINDEATLKRVYYYPDKGQLMLMAENPKYEPLMFEGDELNQIRILGKAIAFQSDVK